MTERTVADLAYTAGFLDADGSFGLYQRESGTIVARVSVTNTDIGVLRWLKERYGGAIYTDVDGTKRKAEWKQRHFWVLLGQPAADLARAVEPYLVIKGERAQIMWEGWATRAPTPKGQQLNAKRGGNAPVDPESVARRAVYVERLRVLNRRGPVPVKFS